MIRRQNCRPKDTKSVWVAHGQLGRFLVAKPQAPMLTGLHAMFKRAPGATIWIVEEQTPASPRRERVQVAIITLEVCPRRILLKSIRGGRIEIVHGFSRHQTINADPEHCQGALLGSLHGAYQAKFSPCQSVTTCNTGCHQDE